LLTPLGRGFTALEIIEAVGAPVVVVAANRLGVLNHAVLTLEALASRRARCAAVVLMGRRKTDASTRSNKAVLAGLVAPVPVLSVPYLGPRAKASKTLAEHAKKCEKTLARIAGWL
jgi:dethiobiotin synthetase